MNKKERMKQILKDTINYYDEDPDNRRSIDKDGNCNYTWGDTHCAVGRYLKPEYQCLIDWFNGEEHLENWYRDQYDGTIISRKITL